MWAHIQTLNAHIHIQGFQKTYSRTKENNEVIHLVQNLISWRICMTKEWWNKISAYVCKFSKPLRRMSEVCFVINAEAQRTKRFQEVNVCYIQLIIFSTSQKRTYYERFQFSFSCIYVYIYSYKLYYNKHDEL